MFGKKKPADDKNADAETQQSEQAPSHISPQDELVWVHFRCGDRTGYQDCGAQFAVQRPRWWADEFIRGAGGGVKCPACDSYGTEVLTTKEQLGLCGDVTEIGALGVRCDRLRGHKGEHEHTWEKCTEGVKKATFTWLNEGEEEDE